VFASSPGQLKEVWMGQDRTREIPGLVYELLNWRDAQRELKALIQKRASRLGCPCVCNG